ncbi:MAG: RdgB/HAM1 family non-canonical purine NTP pyrophosphatase [Chloroflexi bacterium]|nr:RdgB/HAM1 family non-canonical purine NTP pyrophosphatase [Chloroflexota bacterium]
MKLLIASNNAHKQQELREIFDAIGAPVELIAPRAAGIAIDPDESADTYEGNARLKARAFAAALKESPVARADSPLHWVIADDSGLEVDALNGAPGIYSSRYHRRAPGGDGCAALLDELKATPDDGRTARFQCAIVLIDPGGGEHTFFGTCEGRIAHEKRGIGGFGFDPVFLLAGGSRTMAELAPQEKHRVSHRGMAARRAVAYLAGHAM